MFDVILTHEAGNNLRSSAVLSSFSVSSWEAPLVCQGKFFVYIIVIFGKKKEKKKKDTQGDFWMYLSVSHIKVIKYMSYCVVGGPLITFHRRRDFILL